MLSTHFNKAVSDVGIRRSVFKNEFRHLTSFNAGFLVPIESFEVLPGSTWSVDISSFIRASTPIHPVLDDAYLDIFAFFVPMRQTWSRTKEYFGEPNDDPYVATAELIEPGFYHNTDDEINSGTIRTGVISRRSLAAYYGVPIGSVPDFINAKFARGYGLIWNRWFRAQELQNAIDVPLDNIDRPWHHSATVDGELPDVQTDPDYYINCAKDFGHLAPVNKFHDLFTSALRQPQRGDPAAIPLNGIAPVYAIDGLRNVVDTVGNTMFFKPTLNGSVPGKLSISSDDRITPTGDLRVNDGRLKALYDTSSTGTQAYINNLIADLGASEVTSQSLGFAYSTITDLRYAFAVQKYLEVSNSFGSRYREFLKGHFNVDASNIELQDPELLGAKRIHIGMQQVVQTSSTDEVSPQGNIAAFSLTSDRDFLFRKSFTEFGTIHILCCVRTAHSYQQGLAKKFSKRTKWEHFTPEFSNISELPIKNRELYLDPRSPGQDDTFGFQEAWYEYREIPSKISGQFSSLSEDSFDIWHYGDYYESQPYLSAAWIAETYKNVDRTLTVTSAVADQFKADFAFKVVHIEPMPIYSIPGLGTHF